MQPACRPKSCHSQKGGQSAQVCAEGSWQQLQSNTGTSDTCSKYQEPAPRSTPIPWFMKHVDTSKKQTALQENESTNYVIGVMSDSLDYDELPDL